MKNSVKLFLAVVLLLAFGFGYYAYFLNTKNLTVQTNNYNYSFYELVNNVNNIENYLAKAMISNDTKHSTNTLIKIWADSNLAVSYMKNIPFNSKGSDKTIKFLNQVSDYTYTLSKKTLNGESLNEDEFNNLDKLYKYSTNLKNIINQLSYELDNGSISWDDLEKDDKLNSVEENVGVFANIDGNFDDYEGLIYDGAYSDYISKKEKKGLIGEDISKDDAEKKLKDIFGDKIEIKYLNEEEGEIHGYNFHIKKDKSEFEILISKKGGMIVEVIGNRNVGEEKIKDNDAIQKGKEYLEKIGYNSMKETYFLKEANIVTINYAYEENGVLMYPDLIKVKIALDNGEVLGVEALGYLNSHTNREFSTNIITIEEAREKLSTKVKLEKERMAVIPLDDKTEKYCYEFQGRVEDKQFLVYINAETGSEEEILILLETPGGTLTI